MPYRRKDSPYWYISYRSTGGKKVCESTETKDYREAKALEELRKVESRKARKWGEQPQRTFEEVIMAYLDAHEHKRAAARDRYSAVNLGEVFAGLRVGQITGQKVREYRQHRESGGIAPATIRRELGLLSAACNWCRRELEWNVPNPVAGRKPKAPEGRVRWITRAQAAALIQAAESQPKALHLAEFIRLGLNTGMRRGELLGLEWDRVDLGHGMIYLEAEHQKSGKAGSVPLNAEARAVLVRLARFRAEHCPASPWVFSRPDRGRIRSMRRSFATACRAAGIKDFTPHDLRHTCAAWMVQAGVQLLEVCHVLRHSDIRMTVRYAHLAPENVRAAVERLEAGGFNPATPEMTTMPKRA